MKKILVLFLMFSLLLGITVYAIPQFNAEVTTEEMEPLMEKVESIKNGYWFHFQGKDFVITSRYSKSTIPFEVTGDDPELWHYSCIPAGDYYIFRSASMDGVWPNKNYNPVRFYDKQFNLVSEHKFGTHVVAIGYRNGVYYAQLLDGNFANGKVMKSTDRENWEETTEELPRQINGITYTDSKVALNGVDLTPIAYEDGIEREMWSTMGYWILKADDNMNWYLTNDNVYFAKIEMPEVADIEKYEFRCIYENGNNILIDMRTVGSVNEKYLRLTVPKQEIYAELESQKSAPYVKVANEILGFQTAPVTESDRTLVPMRFLFEKLGAEVSWNEATRTATARQANTTINFSIDQKNATVNGQTETMDVPARQINDKTMVPLRFLSENLGYNVDWDENTRMATITE